MSIQLLRAAVLAACISVPFAASAFSITTTGIVGTGYDNNGIFSNGTPNADLSGTAYSLTTTVDPIGYGAPFAWQNSLTYAGAGTQPWTVSLTLNGITRAFSFNGLTSQFGQVTLAADATILGAGNYDSAYNSVSGQDGNGFWPMVMQSVATQHATGISLDFTQSWFYLPQSDDWSVTSFSDLADGLYLYTVGGTYPGANGTVDSISLNADSTATAVPEPASISLMGLALLCATFTAQRRESARSSARRCS